MLLKELIPGCGKLELDSLEIVSSTIVLTVHATSPEAQCPVCHSLSSYEYSVYLYVWHFSRKPLFFTN